MKKHTNKFAAKHAWELYRVKHIHSMLLLMFIVFLKLYDYIIIEQLKPSGIVKILPKLPLFARDIVKISCNNTLK